MHRATSKINHKVWLIYLVNIFGKYNSAIEYNSPALLNRFISGRWKPELTNEEKQHPVADRGGEVRKKRISLGTIAFTE
jgi:hypothetical protein